MKFILFLSLLLFTGRLEKSNLEMSEKKNQIKKFLNNISQIESSGGKNQNHPEIKSGIHQGDKAIGRYGLMPNTVSEVLNRMKSAGTLTPEMEELQKLDSKKLKEKMESNPELQDKVAESLADRVLTRQGDEEKAAYSWHKGHNLNPEKVKEDYENSDYVKKYKKLIGK